MRKIIGILAFTLATLFLHAEVPSGALTVKGWSLPTGDIAGYNLYMSAQSQKGYKKVNAHVVTGLSFAVNGVVPNVRYYFVMTQVTKGGVESRPSQEFSMLAAAGALPQPPPARGIDFEDLSAIEISTRKVQGGGGYVDVQLSQELKHGGQYSLCLESHAAGSASGANFRGKNPERCAFSVPSAAALTIWAYAEHSTKFSVGFTEGKGRGPAGLIWMSRLQATPKVGEWIKMSFPLNSFVPALEIVNGRKPDAFIQNHGISLACIDELRIMLGAGSLKIYVDDMAFE